MVPDEAMLAKLLDWPVPLEFTIALVDDEMFDGVPAVLMGNVVDGYGAFVNQFAVGLLWSGHEYSIWAFVNWSVIFEPPNVLVELSAYAHIALRSLPLVTTLPLAS